MNASQRTRPYTGMREPAADRPVASSYPTVLSRMYAQVRLAILSPALREQVFCELPSQGVLLDIGCGYGLMGCLLGLSHPSLRYVGVDLNPRRIAIARQAAERLRIPCAEFHCADARAVLPEERFDAILLMDMLHHVNHAAKRNLLRTCQSRLRPGGVLVIKDISSRPWAKMAFTWLLDVVVSRGFEMWYWSTDEFLAELQQAGFEVKAQSVPDRLPYPHVVFRCRPKQA